MNIENKIEQVAVRRQRNWHKIVGNPQVTFDTTASLADLFAQKRLERARSRHGDRDIIVKRARVERELERLMTV